MMMDKWTDRLSDYIDGEVGAKEAEALEAHLLQCADCGRTLHELRAVVARAGQVIDRPPANDLWQGIAARIAETEQGASDATKRRFSFSVPQLAAASVALMLMSAGTMYVMVNDREQPFAQQIDERPASRLADSSPGARTAANYSGAIDELEAALENGRTQLDTSTVRVLETNLRAIDVAIADARQALSRDPDNQYLNRYLDQTIQRKVQLLRRATGILRAQT
jgi:anti-sigma factor RsiW